VQKIAVTDWWGPAGPGNTFFRNCIRFRGLNIDDSSHGQVAVGNTFIDTDGNGLFVAAAVHGTVAAQNRIGGKLVGDPKVPVPKTLYLCEKPAFFGTMAWPPIGPEKGESCTNPAAARAERRPAAK
jgi:hypothetical protein